MGSLLTVLGSYLGNRNSEFKGGPLSRRRLDPDTAALSLNDLLADRKADAGSRILRDGVKSLECPEDSLDILRLNPYTVVRHGELPERAAAGFFSGN